MHKAPPTGMPKATPTDAPALDDSGSLADHEARIAARNDRGQFQPRRNRAESQEATPDDVPKINELTKRLREAEKNLGIERLEGESERVHKLRVRAEVAERVLESSKPKPAPVAAPQPRVAAPVEFTDPEPKITDAKYKDLEDPYASWLRDASRWDQKKEDFEKQAEQSKSSSVDAIEQQRTAHRTRLATYFADKPDGLAAINAAPHKDVNLPIAFEAAIVLSDDGPKFSEYLARNPAVFDELYVLSEGKAPSAQLVAHLQRLLTERTAAVTTGAAPVRTVVKPAQAPPTPVRTVPQAPISDGRPKETDSLSAHEHFHYPEGSRGRFRR